MILRSLPLQAALASGIALLAISAVGQTPGKPATTPAQQSPYQGTVVEEIVARINDQIISKSDYLRAEQELNAQGQQQSWSQQQLFEQRHDLLRDLIDQQLLLSKGKELGITGETELVKRLDDIRKQNHLESMDDLQKAAESQNVSYEDFKQHIRDGIISSQVIGQEVGRRLNLTQADVQAYYNAHKDQFTSPEQVTLSEILIPTANPDDATQVAAAQAKADQTMEKLKGGADFAQTAKTDSGGATAAQGGELGEYKRRSGQLAKVIEDQTFDLKPGEYTQPIRTKQGFVILKVTAHKQGGVQPLSDVEQDVEGVLYNQKMGPKLREYLTQLRTDAYIAIKLGYEDSAATPNETTPTTTYSAYTPPTGKKKKHVDRTRFRQKARTSRPATETASSAAPGATAPAAPAGVPSLDQVPQGGNAAATQTAENATPAAPGSAAATSATTPATSSSSSSASKKSQQTNLAGVEKPGKKEKIRFGQAPRETLPAAETRQEDAGASGSSTASTQEAANNVPQNLQTIGQAGDEGPVEKKEKSRFSARAKLPKQKKSKDKTDPFAPSAEPTDEVADHQAQSAPLGLNGDTTHPKKEKPTEKTRFSDRTKEEKPENNQNQTPSAPAPADQNQTPGASVPATPAPQPAPTQP